MYKIFISLFCAGVSLSLSTHRQFFVASTATFGGALLGITYGVLSASWEPGREGSFWGVNEFKANIPVLMSTVMNKAKGEDGSTVPDEWDDGL